MSKWSTAKAANDLNLDEPQGRMAGDLLEVDVFAEQLCFVAHSDDRDQAIGQLARGISSATAKPVQVGGAFVVAWAIDGEELQPVEEAPEPTTVVPVA